MKPKWNSPYYHRSGDRAEQSVCLMQARPWVSSPAPKQNKTRESCLLPLKLLGKGPTGCLQNLFKRKKNQELNQEKGHF